METSFELYAQQMNWAKRQLKKPWLWIIAPLLLLYLLCCWLSWQLMRRFPDGVITPGGMAKLIWATLLGGVMIILGVSLWQFCVRVPFLIMLVWTMLFHVGAPSSATNVRNQQFAPTVAPTAFATHTRSTWLESLTFLSPQDALKLRTQPDVTNVMVVDESNGRVQIAADLKTNFIGNQSAWQLLKNYPFAISNASVTGTFATVTINGNNINLNVGQAFILSEDPTIAYVMGSDGSFYQASAGFPGARALVNTSASLPSPHLPPNAQMTMPE